MSNISVDLLRVAPGFTHGLTFDQDGHTVICDEDVPSVTLNTQQENVVNLLELIQQEQDILGDLIQVKQPTQEQQQEVPLLAEEEEVLPKEPQVLTLSSLPALNQLNSSEWAILLDPNKPVQDFEKNIPNMAKKFPFELDNFQKLAIMQLEQHNHVFVAAHTSAGKFTTTQSNQTSYYSCFQVKLL